MLNGGGYTFEKYPLPYHNKEGGVMLNGSSGDKSQSLACSCQSFSSYRPF